MRLSPVLASLALCAGSLSAQVTIKSAASFRIEQPVSPGAWAIAEGNFAGVTPTVLETSPLPKEIAGVSVTVDGIAAAMNFAGPTQVNFVVPYGAATGTRPVQIKTATATINATIRIIPAAPALFTKDTTATLPPKGATRLVNGSENTATNPVQRGQYIVLYGSGPGPLSTNPADGAGAPGDPLIRTKSTPQVYIDGILTESNFSGLTPNFAGLWQINALVPDKPFVAGRVPVVVYMDGVDSNEVAIFVAQ